ncbi:predicted protein [Nematostella vectensis]|uniref:Uncharacterized protein n=1 Tax=Nematostella vectensis TaxID=45351 RepID=A7SDT2_NEMVE|nr:predicted protein [Nematostella vectensis]|eukprot:XP_001630192.1 predicted protein [Nematostella vectensis]
MNQTAQRMRTLVSWFDAWTPYQRVSFMDLMVTKVVPRHVCSLYNALESMTLQDKRLDTFECQLRMFSKWFAEWSDTQRNIFVDELEKVDYETVQYFYQKVARTAQSS